MVDLDPVAVSVGILLSLFLVLLNGFFVAAEFALVSVRPSKIEELLQKDPKNKRALAVKRAIENQDNVISATQLGITIASLGLGAVATITLEPLITPFIGITLGAILAFFIVTYLHVVIGELAPKSFSLQYSVRASLWVARPLTFFTWMFSPIIIIFNKTAWLILRLFGVEQIVGHRAHSEDELKLLISQSSEAGVLEEKESAILKRTFDLPDTKVREIMTPRFDLATISMTDEFNDIIKKISETGHSRFPVIGENNGNIVGFLYAKDLLNYLMKLLESKQINKKSSNKKKPDIQNLLRKVDYVPETMSAASLLEKFQSSKRQVAIVVDEFGELSGLISLEDVLELLVGDIQDEYDFEPPEITPISEKEGTSQVSGQTSLDDFNQYFESKFESDNSITIGGFVTELLGRLPEENEIIKVKGLIFTIAEITSHRINTIIVDGKIKKADLT